MARNVLEHRQDATGKVPVRDGAANLGNGAHIGAVTAVFEKRVRLVHHQINHRRTVAVDAQRHQLGRNQAVAQVHRTRRLITRSPDKVERGRPFAPCGTAQALHAPALLIDGYGGVAPHGVTHLGTQAVNLVGRVDIAGKQDEPKRISIPKERFFVLGQARSIRVKDGRAKSHRVTTGIQSAPSATRAEQNRRASLRSAKPCARRR